MKKHIPNIITCMNLVSGVCSVILVLWGYYFPAFCFTLASGVFDFLDGFSARKLKAYSPLGKELDSLADVVSFGLVPALMLFTWYYKVNTDCPSILAFTALLIAPLSAVRLAKFNLDDRQTNSFIGLSTPALALLCNSAVAYCSLCMIAGADSIVLSLMRSSWFIPVVAVLLALMLVSNIPTFSLKGRSPKHIPFFVISFALVVAVWFILPQGIGFNGGISLCFTLIFTLYILFAFIPESLFKACRIQ